MSADDVIAAQVVDLDAVAPTGDEVRALIEANRAVLDALASINAKLDTAMTELGPTLDKLMTSPLVKMLIPKTKG